MNKSESKYFNTALRMDEALIELLEEKDLEFITVKEICQRAGVNRSTFYLHYETISDLVNETREMINRRFLSYFPQQKEEILGNLASREQEELILVTREYLLPYLRFIRENKKVYRAAFRNPVSMQAYTRYGELKRHILGPILVTVTMLMELLDKCEFAQYAPELADSGIGETYNKAVEVMDKLETVKKK